MSQNETKVNYQVIVLKKDKQKIQFFIQVQKCKQIIAQVIQIASQKLYDAVSLFNFMYKKAVKNILQHLLVRSPQQAHQRINNILSNPTTSQKITLQSYTDKFLSNVYCDFMISDQFTLIKGQSSQILLQSKKIQSSLLYQQIVQAEQKNKMEQKIMSCIKKLHQEKQNLATYIEAEDVLLSLNGTDIIELKNYLIFIYRWVLNQQGQSSQQIEQLCQRLKVVVVAKLGEAFTLQQEKNQIDAELKRLKIITKARQYSQKGNKQKAKKYYQKIFQNEGVDQKAKMQALQYLCKQSQKDKDLSYLLGMRIKIKQNYVGSDVKHRYIQYLENVLQSVTINSKSQTIMDQIQ